MEGKKKTSKNKSILQGDLLASDSDDSDYVPEALSEHSQGQPAEKEMTAIEKLKDKKRQRRNENKEKRAAMILDDQKNVANNEKLIRKAAAKRGRELQKEVENARKQEKREIGNGQGQQRGSRSSKPTKKEGGKPTKRARSRARR